MMKHLDSQKRRKKKELKKLKKMIQMLVLESESHLQRAVIQLKTITS